jgi:hypothetical protein
VEEPHFVDLGRGVTNRYTRAPRGCEGRILSSVIF